VPIAVVDAWSTRAQRSTPARLASTVESSSSLDEPLLVDGLLAVAFVLGAAAPSRRPDDAPDDLAVWADSVWLR